MNGIHGGFHGILYNRILPPVFKYGNRLEIPEVLMDKSKPLWDCPLPSITGEYEPSNYMWNGMYGSYMD